MAKEVGRIRKLWDVFRNPENYFGIGNSEYRGGSRTRGFQGSYVSKDSIIMPIYNRIGIDVASVDIKHARVNRDGRYTGDVGSELQNCLQFTTNMDQTPSAFFRDVAMSMCTKGAIAIVPTTSVRDPNLTDSYDPTTLRVGEIVEWYAQHVRVNIYNESTGNYEEIIVPKSFAAVVENPLYSIMNQENSTLQRLLDKLRMLDTLDQRNSAGRLDVIIQLPFSIKSEARREQAEKRKADLEEQLKKGTHGIGYIDNNERITQLNRPAENNLHKQVEDLTNRLYSQLGLTPEIMDGTADETAMINYFNRTIEPFLTAITQAMTRTFISKTARTQGQRVIFYRDPFKLVPLSQIAEIVDKFTRNEVATSNELRSAIGWRPSDDPKANELRNSNLSQAKEDLAAQPSNPDMDILEGEIVDEDLDDDEILGTLEDEAWEELLTEFEDILEVLDDV